MTKISALITAALLVVVDQVIKLWALANLAGSTSIVIIPGLFKLTYVENRGAAFGILQGKIGLLSVVVTIVLLAALFALLSDRVKSKFLIWAGALVIAGGLGNLIDRVTRGFVVDYLDFSALFGFPVFNFADCCVVVGTILILIFILFFDSPEQTGSSDVGQAEKEA